MVHLWFTPCNATTVVPFLKCISNAVWAVIYPKGLTCPSEDVIGSLHILLSLQIFQRIFKKSLTSGWRIKKLFPLDSFWYFWIIFKIRASQFKKKTKQKHHQTGSLNKILINVSHCYRETKGFKVSETCRDICAQFLHTMQKVQNIMGNLILKGCQSRSMLRKVSYGSDQILKNPLNCFILC